MGDGAFGMSGLDIETAARAGAPITTVVLNNGGMATYPGGYPTARELFGTTEMTGDYAKIAEGMGAVGITVTDPQPGCRRHPTGAEPQRRGPHRPPRHPLQHGAAQVQAGVNGQQRKVIAITTAKYK